MKKMSKEMQEFYTQHRQYFVDQGAEGGKTRAKRLTAKQRQRIAKLAAVARWRKKEGPK